MGEGIRTTTLRGDDGGNRAPSFWDRVASGFESFRETATDCTAGLVSGFGPVDLPAPYHNDRTRALCKALGATAGLGVDAVVGASGAAEVGGGAVVSGTGVGAVVGVPVSAAGVLQVGAAAAGATLHAHNFGNAVSEMRRSEDAPSGGGSRSPQTTERVTPHDTVEQARNAALGEVGDLGHDRVPTTGRLGEAQGRINGFQSADGKRGFRIDYDPEKGIHYNWYDWSQGGRGSGGRWGAETFPGGEADFRRMLDQLAR